MDKDTIKIANCSGYYGDKLSAAKEMVDGGPIDVLTGDYLAELTMAILFNQKMQRGADKGYVGTFLKQIKEIANYYKSKQQDLALELKDKNTLLNDEIINTEENKDNMFNEINKLVNKIGNIIAPDVIVSKDEERDNNVIKTWGNKILKTKLNSNEFKYFRTAEGKI